MSVFKNLSLRLRIVLPLLAVTVLGVASLIGYAIHVQVTASEDAARRLMTEMAASQSRQIVGVIDEALATARTDAAWTASLIKGGTLDRAAYGRALNQVLDGNPAITGVYAGLEPDADGGDARYQGTPWGDKDGRLMLYAYRHADGGTGVETTPMTGDPAEENWYHRPLRDGREAVTSPYFYEVGTTRVLMTTVVAPVMVDGRALGVATADLSLKRIQADVGALHPWGDGYALLVSSDGPQGSGQWIAHPDGALLGKPVQADWARDLLAAVADGRSQEGAFTDPATGAEMSVVMVPVRFGRAGEVWGFAVAAPRATILAAVWATRDRLMGVGALVLVVVCGLAVLIGASLSRPLQAMTAVMGRLAGGDTDVVVPTRARGDEIGAMSRAVQVFKEQALHMAEMRAQRRALEAQAAAERRQAILGMAGDFESEVATLVRALGHAVETMTGVADGLNRTVADVVREADGMRGEAHQASANVQTIAAATEQLSAASDEIASQAVRAAEIASEAVGQAEHNGDRMRRLDQAAQRIGEIVDLISGVAGQTNLLALNATIEAARAGAAGKGFAVVAGEVKALATQTAQATGAIADQVGDVQAATVEAVAAIDAVIATVRTISEIAGRIAGRGPAAGRAHAGDQPQHPAGGHGHGGGHPAHHHRQRRHGPGGRRGRAGGTGDPGPVAGHPGPGPPGGGLPGHHPRRRLIRSPFRGWPRTFRGPGLSGDIGYGRGRRSAPRWRR
ncbi:methyl-accepting chemotaxis protein [Azospirillum sp. B4]|uniref:methyl-accepting chemotaxis protein n=1 Tax=Azospirillum sp. B4 TaxID=95605 RepID=UPI000347CB32|nr:methyl-accepting chemotaxis protein [Azospirillum sp. B4]